MKRRIDFSAPVCPVLIPVLLTALWLVLSHITGSSFTGSTPWNTYTLQAMAWRSGQTMLPHDYPYLELAVYNGAYYVSFPPLPSVVLWPLTFLFGEATPDNLLVKIYAVIACEMMYAALRHKNTKRFSALLLSLLVGLSSSLLPMTLEGAVWYHAQVLAWALMMVSVSLLVMDKPTPALLCCALSVACRPFDALYLLPMYLYFFCRPRTEALSLRRTVRRLIPGTALGLAVAAAIAAYNMLRFGNPLEFGHNYLPEFSTQGGVQFSLSHVLNNVRTFVLGLPFDIENGVVQFRRFGYSAFIACPALTLMLIWFIKDLFTREATLTKAVLIVTMLVHFFLLLLHRTFGGFQLGARYTADLLPYAFFYLALSRPTRVRNGVWNSVMVLGCALTCWGVAFVHL